MVSDQANLGDFISLSSSEDEGPPPKKNKRSRDDADSRTSSVGRSKRARVNSSSAGSVSDTRVSEEGEIDENAASDGGEEGQTSSGGNIDKKLDDIASGVFVPPNPPVFVKDSLSFQLPVFSEKREGSWPARFKEWVQLFYTTNSQHAKALKPNLVHTAYRQYIDIHSGLKSGKKKGAKQASTKFEKSGALKNLLLSLGSSGGSEEPAAASAKPASQPTNSDPPSQKDQVSTSGEKQDSLPSQIPQLTAMSGGAYVVKDGPKQQEETTNTNTPPSTAQPLNGATMVSKEGVPNGADALEQQRRYFPSASDPTNMCLLCGQEGHTADNCANLGCRFCGKDGHWDFSCPTIPTRCRKCNQLGHAASICIEKLSLTKEEGLACSYCKSPGHLETDCTETWRSFHPDSKTIKTVAFLPISCATCGSGQHYCTDCPQRQSYASNSTWSLANRNRYLDPASSSTTVEEAHGTVQSAGSNHQPDFKIRGHASRPTHIHYSESDSEVEFLGQRAVNNKSAHIGQIRVSSNIQMPNGRQQPPLPPGPPPSLPPGRPPPPGASGYRSSRPLAPPPSLPAKPPAPTRDYSNVPPPPMNTQDSRSQSGRGRGGMGPRGGRGGRGGGRGSFRGGKFRGGRGK